jgi:hypothetical protein
MTPDYHVEVSGRARKEVLNGKEYYRIHGQALTKRPADPYSPSRTAVLEWHNDK